jgi:hypothetical protein
MKISYLIIFISLILPFQLAGQNKKRLLLPPGSPSKKQGILAEKHNRCFHQNIYNSRQRRAFFPFNKADTIKLISFEAEFSPNQPIYNENGGNLNGDSSIRDAIPILVPVAKEWFSLNKQKVKEMKALTARGISSLTDILYNVGYTPVKNLTLEISDPGAKCYEPRNAILFINEKGNVTQYLEICFSCMKHYWSSSKVADIEYCDNKYELIRKFFLAQGVKYGADPKTIK